MKSSIKEKEKEKSNKNNEPKTKLLVIILVCIVAFSIGLIGINSLIENADTRSDEKMLTYLIENKTYEHKVENETSNELLLEMSKSLDKKFEKNPNGKYMTELYIQTRYNVIHSYNIVDTKNIKIELISEEPSKYNKEYIYRTYTVSYTYVDADGKEYQMFDNFIVNRREHKLAILRLDDEKENSLTDLSNMLDSMEIKNNNQ